MYVMILHPVCSYGTPIWCYVANSYLLKIQRLQNNILRKITGAHGTSELMVFEDLDLLTVTEVVKITGSIIKTPDPQTRKYSDIPVTQGTIDNPFVHEAAY